MEDELDLPWGTVPPVIVELARVLAKRASENARRAERIKWPDKPGDVQEELRLAIGAAHKTTRAATDLRALLSAYAHKFHNPRPVISDLARAQDTSSQGFIRRYSEGTVDAVASLLSPKPDVETVLLAFPSVSILDLVDLGGTVGVSAQVLLDSGRYDAKGSRSRKLRASDTDEDNALDAFAPAGRMSCEDFLYSFKAGLRPAMRERACGASGPRFGAVRALLGSSTLKPRVGGWA